METVLQQERLKQIGEQLQDQLRLQLPGLPLRVQCALKDNLMILVQHPDGAKVDPVQVFQILENTLSEIPQTLMPDRLSTASDSRPLIRLFLRVAGEKKPYAGHSFHYAPTPSSPFPDTPGPDSAAATIAEPPEESVPDGGDLVYTPADSLAKPAQESALDRRSDRSCMTAVSPGPRKPAKSWLLVGGGLLAALLVGGGVYALTRPCVFSPCDPLQKAQTLSQQSAQLLQGNLSAEAEQQAKRQLTEAQGLVNEIPPWSGSYAEAQGVKQSLDQMLRAENKAEQATQKGQTLPQSVTDWQAVESLWREAIAPLETIPPTSSLSPYAQQRLTAYRANLKLTQQRIATEQDARKRLLEAKKTVGLAETRQNKAQQLQDWQIAQSTWLVILNALKQIPNGTTSYAEAQQLIQTYEPKLNEVRDRATKEQLANQAYNQARQQEQQARAWQQKNQWSQAAASWQSSLNYANQVPEETAVSSQAQTLAANAAGALKQAQSVVKIRGDMNRICFASGRICDYSIQNDIIKVKFVPSYERRARTIGGMSYFSRDYETMYKIDQHFASLAKALQAVSNNSALPVQVYNSDNQLLGSFVPGGGQ